MTAPVRLARALDGVTPGKLEYGRDWLKFERHSAEARRYVKLTTKRMIRRARVHQIRQAMDQIAADLMEQDREEQNRIAQERYSAGWWDDDDYLAGWWDDDNYPDEPEDIGYWSDYEQGWRDGYETALRRNQVS